MNEDAVKTLASPGGATPKCRRSKTQYSCKECQKGHKACDKSRPACKHCRLTNRSCEYHVARSQHQTPLPSLLATPTSSSGNDEVAAPKRRRLTYDFADEFLDPQSVIPNNASSIQAALNATDNILLPPFEPTAIPPNTVFELITSPLSTDPTLVCLRRQSLTTFPTIAGDFHPRPATSVHAYDIAGAITAQLRSVFECRSRSLDLAMPPLLK